MADATHTNNPNEQEFLLGIHPKGYHLVLVPFQPRSHIKKIVVRNGGGKLPEELEGYYTDTSVALKHVKQYLDKVRNDHPKSTSPVKRADGAE